MNEVRGKLDGKGLKIAVVVSRFNEQVTERLLEGALDAASRTGVGEEDILVARVPGSFEIPVAAQRLARSGDFAAVVCLGAVIRGETPHFDYICNEVSHGIAQIGLNHSLPVTFGVITADTLEQAMDRSGNKRGNKGAEALLAAVEMARLLEELPGR